MLKYTVALASLAALLVAASPAPHTAARAQDDPLAARAKGRVDAPITVYEMSDFQCPFCRRHAVETLPTLDREYIQTGKVRWVYINFPLTNLHPNAVAAAEVAMCAGRQHAFWPVHDLLFAHQDTWAPLKEPGAFFLSLADSAGLNRPALAACLQQGSTRAEIESDARGASRTGARSTPTFYIEGGLLEGAAPIGVFRHVLDSIYATRNAP